MHFTCLLKTLLLLGIAGCSSGSHSASETAKAASPGSDPSSGDSAGAPGAQGPAGGPNVPADASASNSDSAAATPPVPTCENFTSVSWDTLKNASGFECYKSVDQVFAALPKWMTPYWSFVRTSRNISTASLTTPRIIVSSPDGSITIAAGTDPTSAQQLDILTFNPDTMDYELTGVNYATTPPTVDHGTCTVCHGKQPHPIWASYASWTGIVASSDKIQADEAPLLQALASHQSKLPYVSSLSFKGAGSYNAGGTIFPNEQSTSSPSNQLLNFLSAKNQNRSLAAKILKDPALSPKDIFGLIYQMNCGGQSGAALAKIGYPESVAYANYLEGKDKFSSMNVGFAPIQIYLAIPLLKAMLDKDPTLAAKIGGVATAVNDPRLKGFFSNNYKEFAAAGGNSNWAQFDFSWLPSYKLAWLSSCSAIQSLSTQ